jgi:hypothetical protein
MSNPLPSRYAQQDVERGPRRSHPASPFTETPLARPLWWPMKSNGPSAKNEWTFGLLQFDPEHKTVHEVQPSCLFDRVKPGDRDRDACHCYLSNAERDDSAGLRLAVPSTPKSLHSSVRRLR